MSVVNGCMEDVFLYQYVKIALAVAVVKRKPNYLKVKPYVSGLKQQLHLKDGIWNKKKKKFLECQQEWMSKALPVDLDLDAEVVPFSKECVSLSKFQTHERYLHLMKNVILQCKSVENPIWSSKEESILLWSSLLGAIEYLTVVIQDREPSLPFPKGMYLAGIRKIQDMPLVMEDYSEFTPRMMELVDSLIKCLLHWQGAPLRFTSDDIRIILVSIGSSPAFRDICLLRLAWGAQNFGSSLKVVAKGDCEFYGKVMTYQNVFHLLLALEEILRNTFLKQETCSETVSSIYRNLNSSLQHISAAFPVFTHFVWRLQLLLSGHPSFSEQEEQKSP